MAAVNKVIRLALSDAGSSAFAGLQLSNAEITNKQEAGRLNLLVVDSVLVTGVCHDYSGNLYVTDTSKDAIFKVSEGGALSVFSGLPGTAGNNSALQNVDIDDARYNNPYGIACDKSGNVYVADTGNNRIRKIDKDAKVTTLAGGFNAPEDVVVAPNGEIIVADTGNHKIYKIEQHGRKLLLAGTTEGDVSGRSCRSLGSEAAPPQAASSKLRATIWILVRIGPAQPLSGPGYAAWGRD